MTVTMKHSRTVIFSATTMFLLCNLKVTNQHCLTPSGDRNSKHQNSGREEGSLYMGQQQFALDSLQSINRLRPNDNLFFSPYSTYHALMMAYFIAANDTEEQLQSLLHLNPKLNKADIYDAYKLDKFTKQIRASNASYEFTNANKMFVASNVPVRECIEEYFDEELEKMDFKANPVQARQYINHWVENQTHNMIQELLPSNAIDHETTLVLANAAYFKGMWKNKFDAARTVEEPFYVSPHEQIMVNMMHLEGSFNHEASISLGAHILEMPYQSSGNSNEDKISMFILLPPFSRSDSVANTLSNLTLDSFKNIVEGQNSVERTVQVSLPKFSLEHSIDLTPVFRDLGAGSIFEPTANYSTLSPKISLGNALHKAKIEVNEEGTKAAAATVLFTFRSSRPLEPAQFLCNHPFIYFIYDKEEESIIFSGIFRRPQ